MSRPRQYATDAERQAAYRQRQATPPDVSPVAVLEPAVVPAAPAAVEPPPTLLQQTEQRCQQARLAEHAAHRALEVRGLTPPELAPRHAAVVRAQRETFDAQSRLAQHQRALTTLRARVPGVRVALRRAEGELALLEEELARRLTRARREVQQLREELLQLLRDIVAIGGEAALPRED
jgi:hypothetical protein